MAFVLLIIGIFIALIGIGWTIGNVTLKKPILKGLIVLIVGCVILGCGIFVLNLPQTYDITPTPSSSSYSAVVYEITGTATSASVTLNNGEGGTEQYALVAIPWSYTEKSFSDSFLYISAQNLGESGTVTVKIYVDGELFKTSSSSGAYVIASASGLRP